MPGPKPLPPALGNALLAYDRRSQRVVVWRGVGETAIVGGIAVAGIAVIDICLHPGYGSRLALSLSSFAVVSGVFIARSLVPFLREPSPIDSARAIERTVGTLDERLSSAVQLSLIPTTGVSEWMVNRTIALAAQDAASLHPESLVDHRPARRALVPAAVLAGVMSAACFVPGVPSLYLRALWPGAGIVRPARVSLTVSPGDRLLALGSPLAIEVAAEPQVQGAELAIAWQDGVRETVAMTPAGPSRFLYQLGAVTRAFTYVARAGDAESREFRVAVAVPPRIERLTLHITPPAYTGLGSREVDGGDAEIVAGSSVSLVAQLSGEAVSSASVLLDGSEQAAFIEPAQDQSGAKAHAELHPTADLAYGLRLVGASGLSTEAPQRWLLTVVPDKPPTSALTAPSLAGGLVGSDEAVAVTATASDDLGLRRVELEVVHDEEARHRSLPLPAETGSGGSGAQPQAPLPKDSANQPKQATRQATLPATVDVSEWGLAAGDTITITAIATDVGGQSARSESIHLVIGRAEDGAVAAQAMRLRSLLDEVDAHTAVVKTQARGWATLARGGMRDDQASARGDLAIIEDRVAVWRDGLNAVSAALIAEGAVSPRGNEVRLDAELGDLGRELGVWADGLAEQVRAIAMLASIPARAPEGPSPMAYGSAVAEAAVQDLAVFRHDLAILVARLEADALIARCDVSEARLSRSLAIVRGDRGWRAGTVSPGLSASFFRGLELQGPVVFSETGLPVIDTRQIPDIGAFNYSARWEGEVEVPVAGDWTFQATADDGVRLNVGGKDLIGPEAWTAHPPIAYPGTVTLAAGWHPLRLEFMQGGGGAFLRLAAGPAGGPLVELGADRLRSRASAQGDPALVAAMVSLPPGAVDAAEERTAASFTVFGKVPATIAAFADTASSEPIKRIADEGKLAGDGLAALAQARALWTVPELDRSLAPIAALAQSAKSARDQLEAQVREVATRHPALGALSELRQAMRRAHDRLDRIYRLPADLQPADRRQSADRAMAATRSWFEQMLRDAPRARAALLGDAGADARTRLSQAITSRKAAAVSDLLRETISRIDRIKDSPQEAPEIGQYWKRIDDLLRGTETSEGAAHRFARADAAREALIQLQALKQAEAQNRPADALKRYQAVHDAVEAMAAAEHAEGKDATARELEAMVGADRQSADLPKLEARLREYDRQDRGWQPDSVKETAAALKQAAERLAKADDAHRPEALAEARLAAREAAVSTAAEGERRREANPNSDPQRDQASGFASLAHDLDRFSDQGRDAAELSKLADRASTLAGDKGVEAQRWESALAAPATPEADALEKLAQAVAAASAHPEKRPEALAGLRAAAAEHRDPSTDPARAAEAAQALAEALSADQRNRDAEAEARQRFAADQADAAVAAEALAAKAGAASRSAQDAQSRTAMEAIPAAAQPAVAAARGLAAKAGDGVAPTDELADAARTEAARLEQSVARPIAEAFKRSGSDADALALADLGREAAALAARQRQAAERLDHLERQRVAGQERLAEAVSSAVALAGTEPSAEAAQAQAGADAAQHQARQASSDATNAWNEARAQAERAAAAPGDAAMAAQAATSRGAAEAQQQRATQARDAAAGAQAAAAAAAAGQDPLAGAPLVAAQAHDLAQAEHAARGLADASAPLSQANADSERAAARAAAAAGRQADARLRASAEALQKRLGDPSASQAAMAANATPSSDPAAAPAAASAATSTATSPSPASAASPSSAPSTADVAAQAMAAIAADPSRAESFQQAAHILGDAAESRRMDAATAQSSKSSGSAQKGGSPGKEPSGTSEARAGESDPGSAASLELRTEKEDRPDWARLSDKARRNVRVDGVERFSEEHQEAIRAYLRRLGEEK